MHIDEEMVLLSNLKDQEFDSNKQNLHQTTSLYNFSQFDCERKLVIFRQNLEIATTVQYICIFVDVTFCFPCCISLPRKIHPVVKLQCDFPATFFSYCVISRIYINLSEKQEKLKQILFDKLSFLKLY